MVALPGLATVSTATALLVTVSVGVGVGSGGVGGCLLGSCVMHCFSCWSVIIFDVATVLSFTNFVCVFGGNSQH